MNNTRIHNNIKKINMEPNTTNNTLEFQRYDNQYYNNNKTSNNHQQNNNNNHKSLNYEKDTMISANESSMIPKWKIPLSKSFSSALTASRNQYLGSDEDSSSYGNGSSSNEENKPLYYSSFKEEDENSNIQEKRDAHNEKDYDDGPTPEPTNVIQILLPCIICNRTFSPEALERHSKICTKVNVNDVRIKHPRPTFDSAKARIKDTKLEFFIPPPSEDEIGGGMCGSTTPTSAAGNDWGGSGFTRAGRGRSSFQDKTNTRFSFGKGSLTSGGSVKVRGSIPAAWRRATSVPKSEYGEFDDGASSITMDNDYMQPSYSKTLSPSEDCPYCGRSFGMKAYDRHVNHCKEVWERKQYEIQPTPKEIEIARLRQEVRTKYKPMKGSSSWSSLRSFTSPSNDNFATNALNRLFGGLKRVENINLQGKSNRGSDASLIGFKKSNESLASSSCYGDFNRPIVNRKRNPSSPSLLTRHHGQQMTASLHIPTSSSTIGGSKPSYANRPGTLRTLNSNTSSHIPLYNSNKHKSTENLDNTPSSGYGPGGSYMSGFSRNSKSRSSLNKNYFFRNPSQRVEPEGTENNSYESNVSPSYINTRHTIETNNNNNNDKRGIKDKSSSSAASSVPPLIITPMNFYSKPSQSHQPSSTTPGGGGGLQRSSSSIQPLRVNNRQNYGSNTDDARNEQKSADHYRLFGNSSSSSNSKPHTEPNNSRYDPYEKAAQQLEELFRKQPPAAAHRANSNKIQRKIGLDRAFASVCGIGDGNEAKSSENYNDDEYSSTKKKDGGRYNQRKGSDESDVLQINEDDFDMNSSSSMHRDQNSYYNTWDDLLGNTGKNSKQKSDSTDSYYDKPIEKTLLHENENKSSAANHRQTDFSDLLSRRFNSTNPNTKSDANMEKSTRASNTSSADSAFSRSDGTDLEFEALESLVELGQLPPSSSSSGTITSTTLPNIISSHNPNEPKVLIHHINTETSQDRHQHQYNHHDLPNVHEPHNNNHHHNERERRTRLLTTDSVEDEPMAISSSSSSTSSQHNNNNNSYDDDDLQHQPSSSSSYPAGGSSGRRFSNDGHGHGERIISTTIIPDSPQQNKLKPMLAKFCHECGKSYPTGDAKFCPECGERRVIHV